MRWFRRELDDFGPFDWDSVDGFIVPSFPYRPEPWRDADYDFVVPLSFALIFADEAYMAKVEREDAWYIAPLVESINREGLREPVEMVFDGFGKLRYHDGYHRLIAMRHVGWIDRVPVRLRQSPRVRGYGRLVSEELVRVFGVIHELQERS